MFTVWRHILHVISFTHLHDSVVCIRLPSRVSSLSRFQTIIITPEKPFMPSSPSPLRSPAWAGVRKAPFSSFPPMSLNPRHRNIALGMLKVIQLHHSTAWLYNHCQTDTQNSVAQAWEKETSACCVQSPWPCLPFICLHVKSRNPSSAVSPGFSNSSYLVIFQRNASGILSYVRALQTDFPLSKPTHLSMRPPWLVHLRQLLTEQVHDFFKKHSW